MQSSQVERRLELETQTPRRRPRRTFLELAVGTLQFLHACLRGFIGGMREEVLSFEPPKRMTYTVIAGFFPIEEHEGEVVFEPDGEGTLVIWRCHFKSKIPGLGGVLERIITATFRRSLKGLERHIFS